LKNCQEPSIPRGDDVLSGTYQLSIRVFRVRDIEILIEGRVAAQRDGEACAILNCGGRCRLRRILLPIVLVSVGGQIGLWFHENSSPASLQLIFGLITEK